MNTEVGEVDRDFRKVYATLAICNKPICHAHCPATSLRTARAVCTDEPLFLRQYSAATMTQVLCSKYLQPS